MKNLLDKNCVKRSLRTFLQTAAGYVSVNIAMTDLNTKSAVTGLAVAAIAAGISAVMNLNEN